jgi:hypothetical protein
MLALDCAHGVPTQAALKTIANLRAVAEQGVITSRIVGCVVAGVGSLIARINRAGNAVAAVHRSARLAAKQRIARLRPVTVEVVVAKRVFRSVITCIRGFVARINRAVDAVVAIDGRTGLARTRYVTRFLAVAVKPVVTIAVRNTVDAGIVYFVAHLPGTRIAAGLAPGRNVTGLNSVTIEPVVAKAVVRDVIARIGRLAARVYRASTLSSQ